MAIQLRDATRNARLDQIDTDIGTTGACDIFTGVPPADVTQANSGTLLASITLPNPAFAAASGGVMSKNGTWEDTSADAGGTPGHFRIYNSTVTKDGTTCQMQGTCGVGSGDIDFDGSITAGQQVTISTLDITEGNA